MKTIKNFLVPVLVLAVLFLIFVAKFEAYRQRFPDAAAWTFFLP